MKSSSDLFDLIKSLSPAEKGYFKKYASLHGTGDKKYVKLFDAINAQPEYDEAKLKRKFAQSFSNFSVYKSYTYKLLMDSLREYHKSNDPFSTASDYISNTNLLGHKNLFEQGLDFARQADEMAKENDEPLLRLAALERESILLNISNNQTGLKEFYHSGFKKYEMLMEEISLNWKIRKCTNWLRLYKITLSHPILKSEAEHFIREGEELLADLPFDRLAVYEKLTYHQLAAVISTTRHYLVEAKHHYTQMLKLYEDKKLLRIYYFDYVMTLNSNILFNIQYGFQDDSLFKLLDEVVEKGTGAHQQIARAMAKRVRYHLMLMKLNREGNFKAAEKIIDEHRDWLRRHQKSLPARTRLTIYYEQAITYYGLKKEAKALLCVRHVLEMDKNMERTKRLSALMLEIIIQYESGETGHLLRLTRLFHKELMRYRLMGSYYRLCSDWFADTIRSNPAEVKKRIASFYPKIQALIHKEAPPLQVLLADFLLPWLKARAEGKDFVAAVKMLHAERLQPR